MARRRTGWHGLNLDSLTAPPTETSEYGRPGRLALTRLLRNVLSNHVAYEGLLLSNPYVDDKDKNNENWVPHQALGAGGFGKVVAFAKKDALGETEKIIAVKQRRYTNVINAVDGIWTNNLAREAFLQSQLSTNDRADCVVRLERYKCYPHDDNCRLYMEYAPYGDLDGLRLKYRAFERHLPELLLWEIFEKLAAAVDLMEMCPKIWHPIQAGGKDAPNPDNYILHLDIKPQNIFVFENRRLDRNKKIPPIPIVKLGDFGLSEVTHRGDARNPFNRGTNGYKPPECHHLFTDVNGAQRFIRFDDGWGPGHPPVNVPFQEYQESYNIWCIGKVMYDLLTMCDPEDIATELAVLQPVEYYQPLVGPRPNPMHFHYMEPIVTTRIPPSADYGPDLRRLVRECLRPAVGHRPLSNNLLADIRTYKAQCIRAMRRDNQTPPGRPRAENQVYVTNAQINAMNLPAEADFGPADKNDYADWCDWRQIRGELYRPDEEILNPPAHKWVDFYDHERQNPFRAPLQDPIEKHWRKAGDTAHVTRPRPGTGLPPRQNGLITKEAKRLRSWDDDFEQDVRLRDILRDVRRRVQAFAADGPLEMVEFVLNKSHMQVDQAEMVLRWLYVDRQAADPSWRWARDKDVTAKAKRVQNHIANAGGEVSFKECQYIVAHTDYGVDQVPGAARQLWHMYYPRTSFAIG